MNNSLSYITHPQTFHQLFFLATATKINPSQRNNHLNPLLNVVDGHLVTRHLKRMKKKWKGMLLH